MLTDPVYEGKSMLGMLDNVRCGEFEPGSTVLYALLGGIPALSAYHEIFRNGAGMAMPRRHAVGDVPACTDCVACSDMMSGIACGAPRLETVGPSQMRVFRVRKLDD